MKLHTRRSHTYRLYRGASKKVVNISASLVLVGMSLGGALPAFITSHAHAEGIVVSPSNAQGWTPDDVRGSGIADINTNHADSTGGSGSLNLALTNEYDKAGFKKLADFGLVSTLSKLSFDWYRDSSSTAAGHLTPAFSILASDGAGNSWQLKWEGAYNDYPTTGPAAPTDTWITENLLNGKFWRIPQTINGNWVGFSHCNDAGDPYGCFNYTRTLSDTWLSGFKVAGIGVSDGSGWSGTYNSYIDKIAINNATYDFEANSTPPTVYVDEAYTTEEAGGHSYGYDAFTNLQDAINAVKANGIINLESNVTVNQQMTIAKTVTLSGNNHTIFGAYDKTNSSNNSVLSVQANGVRINQLTIDGQNHELHGINVYSSQDLQIWRVNLNNNGFSGLNVNRSWVQGVDLHTQHNGWNGVDIDGTGAIFQDAGQNTHNETLNHADNGTSLLVPDLYVDDVNVGTVNDTNGQYTHVDNYWHNGDRAYFLKPVTPTTPTFVMKDANGTIINNGDYTKVKDYSVQLSDSSTVDHYKLKFWNSNGSTMNTESSAWMPSGDWSGHMNQATGLYTDNFTLGNGVYHLKFAACTANDVCSDFSQGFTVTYDNLAPKVGLTAPSGTTNTTTADVKGYVTDANMRYYACYITTDQTITAFDQTWTTGQEPKSGTNHDQSLANSTCVTDWTNTDTGSLVNPVTLGSFDTSGLPDGNYTIHVHAHDQAGNIAEDATTFIIDRTAPTVPVGLTVISPTVNNGNATNSSTATTSWGASSDISSGVKGYEYWVITPGTHNASNPYTTFVTSTSLPGSFNEGEGTYTFKVRAQDNAGNWSDFSNAYSVVYDKTAPALNIVSYGQNENIFQPVISVDGITPTSGSGYTYSWTPVIQSGVTLSSANVLNPKFSLSQDGTYDYNLTVTDVAGNTTLATLTFTYATPAQTAAPTVRPAPAFTAVSTSNTTRTGGTGTPVPLTDNQVGATAPEVLGSTTDSGNTKGQVKGDTITLQNSSKKHGGTFLGLGYWWIAIIAAVAVGWWLLIAAKRRKQN